MFSSVALFSMLPSAMQDSNQATTVLFVEMLDLAQKRIEKTRTFSPSLSLSLGAGLFNGQEVRERKFIILEILIYKSTLA